MSNITCFCYSDPAACKWNSLPSELLISWLKIVHFIVLIGEFLHSVHAHCSVVPYISYWTWTQYSTLLLRA